jgi:hypothetical protein
VQSQAFRIGKTSRQPSSRSCLILFGRIVVESFDIRNPE